MQPSTALLSSLESQHFGESMFSIHAQLPVDGNSLLLARKREFQSSIVVAIIICRLTHKQGVSGSTEAERLVSST